MYKIIKKELLAPNIYLMEVYAPRIAASAKPGQFLIVIADNYSERIPLTISDYDVKRGTVEIVIQAAGPSTRKICEFEVGESFLDFVGPLGRPSDLIEESVEELKKKKFLFVAGGVGTAPIYPQVKWLFERGMDVDVIIGARSKEFLILEDKLKKVSTNLYVSTDDGSYGYHGNVTNMIDYLYSKENKKYDHCVTIGPMIMMKFVCLCTKKYDLKTIVSLNPIMVDGTGMCGACRVKVGSTNKFACVDGPEFDGHLVDFDTAIKRQHQYENNPEQLIEDNKDHVCSFDKAIARQHRNRRLLLDHDIELVDNDKKIDRFTVTPISEQAPDIRNKNFDEVCLGYSVEEAMIEAKRCLNCKVPMCVKGCPVSINIPGFIKEIVNGNFEQSAKVLSMYTALPAVCGRVCPQETQCEKLCILTRRGDSVAIGKLERFAADFARENEIKIHSKPSLNGHKVAVVGAGPAGLTCAGELARMGYEVTIFEALHLSGGVLIYGIPTFRLPDEVVEYEINNLIDLGVKIENDVIIGRTITIDEILKEGYEAVFIGSGAGLPKFMNIEGENLNGVYSANEFLTRNNLMKSFKEQYDTPIKVGDKVAIIGGGNVAMDAARVAKRLGADVSVVYRRTEEELPARLEEIHHAKEEGISFKTLTTPVEIIGDENGWVKGLKCVKNQLGEPDESGRRRPVEIQNSEYIEEFQTIIMALGTSPNPLISHTTDNLEVNKWGCIVADEDGRTSRKEVFAGGDAVTGAATVILAMGAGKKAARAIDKYIRPAQKLNKN